MFLVSVSSCICLTFIIIILNIEPSVGHYKNLRVLCDFLQTDLFLLIIAVIWNFMMKKAKNYSHCLAFKSIQTSQKVAKTTVLWGLMFAHWKSLQGHLSMHYLALQKPWYYVTVNQSSLSKHCQRFWALCYKSHQYEELLSPVSHITKKLRQLFLLRPQKRKLEPQS